MITRFISLIITISLSGIPAYAADPIPHLRIEYDRFNTPDSTIFASLLDYVAHTDWRENMVSTEMNMTYDREIDAWVIAPNKTPRHSREDVQKFVTLFLDVADKSQVATVKLKRKLFCPSQKFKTMEQRFVALETWDIEEYADAEYYLNYTMEQMGEQARADLRAWLYRNKQGFMSRKYNARTKWAGRESDLDTRFADICNEIGGR